MTGTGALLSIGFALSTEAAGALLLSGARGKAADRLSASLLAGLVCVMGTAVFLLLLPLPDRIRTAMFWVLVVVVVLVRWRRFFALPRGLWPGKRWSVPASILALGALAQLRKLYAGPLDSIDFRTIYGLRARYLYLPGGGLSALFDRYATPWHGFYPPALPLLYAGAAVAFGRFDEQLLAIVPAIATVIVLAGAFELFVALDVAPLPAGLWAAVVALSPGLWAATEAGQADLPLAAALVVAASALLRGDSREDRVELRLAAAFAALLKNEGFILAVLLLAADWILHHRRGVSRSVGHLAALAPGAVWMAAAAVAGFPRDTGPVLLSPSAWKPALSRLPAMLELLGPVAVHSVNGPFLLCLPVGLAFAIFRRSDPLLRRIAAVSAVLLLQFVAILYVYLVTPYHVIWLMWVSIERILAPLAVAEVLVLASLAGREAGAPTFRRPQGHTLATEPGPPEAGLYLEDYLAR